MFTRSVLERISLPQDLLICLPQCFIFYTDLPHNAFTTFFISTVYFCILKSPACHGAQGQCFAEESNLQIV